MNPIKKLLKNLSAKPTCIQVGCEEPSTHHLHTRDGLKLHLCQKHYEEWIEKKSS